MEKAASLPGMHESDFEIVDHVDFINVLRHVAHLCATQVLSDLMQDYLANSANSSSAGIERMLIGVST